MSDNPFLLPRGAKPTVSPASPTEPPVSVPAPDATPPPRDPDHYIAIPASVESATHRIARTESPTAVEIEPRPEPEVDAAAPEQDPIAEETQLAVSPRPTRSAVWQLVLPDGSRIGVTGPLLIGRDPATTPEYPLARLLPVHDETKTVSKTHALIEPSGAADGIRVHDLFSTNGIGIDVDGSRTVVTPGAAALACPGAWIALGSFRIGVAAGGADPA